MAPEVKSPVTDSPWFWVLMFAGMALLALLVIGPKYGGRQARLERQYQARERIAAERAGGNQEADFARSNEPQPRQDFSSSDDTLIPLWPLAVLLSAVMILAAVMLARNRWRRSSSVQDALP